MNINLLLQKPNNNKLTFNEALAEIASIADNLDPTAIQALQFFINKAQKKELGELRTDNPFKLASLFMAKKDSRYYLNYIYSDGQHLTASNGHILIKINHACQSGFYNSTGQFLENQDFAKYPSFDKHLLLSNEKEVEIDNLLDGESKLYSKFAAKQVLTQWFNEDYLKLLKRIKPEKIVLNNNCNLFAKSKDYVVIIMPVRVD